MDEEEDESKSHSDTSDDDDNRCVFASSNRFAGLAATKKKPPASTAPKYFGQLPSATKMSEVLTAARSGGGNRYEPHKVLNPKENATTSDYGKPAFVTAVEEFWTLETNNGNERIMQIDFPQFLRRYDTHLSCDFCFDTPHNTVKLMAHDCDHSRFLCRPRVEDDVTEYPSDDEKDYKKPLKWNVIRPFLRSVGQLHHCPGGPSCIRGVACPKAHSDVELEIWTEQYRTGIKEITPALRNKIYGATIINSSRVEKVLFPDGSEKEVSVWVACSLCATFIRKQYWVLRYWDHQCQANMVFIRYDFQPAVQPEFWVFIRPSPAVSMRRGPFDLCHHIEIGCWRGFWCKFPHSNLEASLWAFDKCDMFSLDDFLKNILETRAEHDWKPTTFTGTASSENADSKLSVDQGISGDQGMLAGAAVALSVSPLNLDDNENDFGSDHGFQRWQRLGGGLQRFQAKQQPVNTGRSKEKKDSRSGISSGGRREGFGSSGPFKIQTVCISCFKNGGILAYQKGTYCETRSVNHTWERHKGFIIYDEEGKASELRNLPPSIQVLSGTKKPNVKLCHRIAKYGKCSFPSCGFAHNRMELRCWIWLLIRGKTVADIAEAAPVTSSVERKALVQVSAAASRANSATPSRTGASWAKALAPSPSNAQTARPFAVAPPSAVFSRPPPPRVPIAELLECLEQELEDDFYCYLCDKGMEDQATLNDHLYTEAHRNRSALMEGRTWKYRHPCSPPPWKLCEKHLHGERCSYSKASHNRCRYAHSQDELDEWNERFDFLNRALARKENEAMSDLKVTISEQQRLGKGVLTPCADYVEISCDQKVQVSVEKGQSYIWKFMLLFTAQVRLHRVVLLDHDSAVYFRLKSQYARPQNDEAALGDIFACAYADGCYEVIVEFVGSKTSQTFTQRIAFDCGRVPIVYQEVIIHSGLDKAALAQQNSLRRLLQANALDQRWTPENSEIIWISKARSEERMNLNDIVANLNFEINESNYFSLLRQWLFAEEYQRQAILDKLAFNKVQITAVNMVYDDDDRPVYPHRNDTLFAVVQLKEPLSEDIDAVTLLREDCTNAFVAVSDSSASGVTGGSSGKKRMVYEVDVVNKLRFKTQGIFADRIHLHLSAFFVRHMHLKHGSKITIDVQFNFWRKQFRQWLRGLGRLQERDLGHLIFPELQTYYPDYLTGKVMANANAKIAAMPRMLEHWKRNHNSEQRNVMGHILSCAMDRNNWIPPLVVFGPFGTGKTRTLAAATATLLVNPSFSHTRILICTHAQTTADIYIRLLQEHTGLPPVHLRQILWRVFHNRARPETEDYIRFEHDPETNSYRPEKLTLEKLRTIRVVICTFSASDKLVKDLKGLDDEGSDGVAFTHIFIDEAAQALELETVLPLCLANRTTCVVLAGDHHQIRPTVYLPQAKELGRSYLERLYCYYDEQKQIMEKTLSLSERARYRIPSILFNKNYRCHPDILAFLSSVFYGDSTCLVACGESYDSSGIKPLYFVSSASDEEVGKNGSVINRGEAKMVADQVEYLWYNWPKAWGSPNIGVAVPYREQANVIKDLLKAKKVSLNPDKVDVTRVIQMQGKEYKALVISTVRGKTQLVEAGQGNRARDLAFLDDPRLINTAMTRAKYTVVTVGDAAVLCTLGLCRDIWYRYIATCGRRQGTLLPDTVKWAGLECNINMYRDKFEKAVNTTEAIQSTTADDLLVQQLTKKTQREMK